MKVLGLILFAVAIVACIFIYFLQPFSKPLEVITLGASMLIGCIGAAMFLGERY